MSEILAIGVDVGGTNVRAATLGPDGTLVARSRRPTPVGDADALVATIADLVNGLEAPVPVGVGFAALVDPQGLAHFSPNVQVERLALAERLAEAVGRPVRVLNDASAAALGEQRHGAAAGRDDVVLLTIGTGVGGGVVAGGRLLLGAHGFGAELGHVIVEPDGRRCPCGNRGCVEAYASGTSIGLLAREGLVDRSVVSQLRDRERLTGSEVTRAAAGGDEYAMTTLAEVGRWLGIAVASITNALDPEIVLLGGGAAEAAAPWVLPPVREALTTRVIGASWRTLPTVELAALGDDAGVIGAACHALEPTVEERA